MIKFSELIEFLSYKNSDSIIPQGWKLLSLESYTNSGKFSTYGFINEEHNQVVITNNDNLLSSSNIDQFYDQLILWFEIINNEPSSQFNSSSIPFLNELFKILPSNNLKFINVGHSASSVISDMMTAYMLKKGLNAQSYTFENPGSKAIIEKYIAPLKFKINDLENKFTSINVENSYISNNNSQIGKVIKIIPVISSWVNKFEAIYSNISSVIKLSSSVYNMAKKVCDTNVDFLKSNVCKLSVNNVINVEYFTKSIIFQVAYQGVNTFGNQIIEISKSIHYNSLENLSEALSVHENLNSLTEDKCSPIKEVCD